MLAREDLVGIKAELGPALAYGIVLHGVVVLPVLLAGLACLWKEDVTLYRLVAEARRE